LELSFVRRKAFLKLHTRGNVYFTDGYVILHVPGGMLAEKYGGKYTLSLGILSTAIFTLLTPICIQWGELNVNQLAIQLSNPFRWSSGFDRSQSSRGSW